MIAYDSAYPQNIPPNPPAIFPYGDGRNQWSRLRFPEARFRYITITGDPGCDIADFELGCIWPASNLLKWAEDRRDRHPQADLTVYCDRDNFDLAENALMGWTWHLFLATLDGSQPKEWTGKPCRAVQYSARDGLYDESVVYDESWLNRP